MVEKYILGQKGYKKTDTVPVVVIDEEKVLKHRYITLHSKLFKGTGTIS